MGGQKWCDENPKHKHDKVACPGTHYENEGDNQGCANAYVGIAHCLNGRAMKKNFVWKSHNYEDCIRNEFPDEVDARKEMICILTQAQGVYKILRFILLHSI